MSRSALILTAVSISFALSALACSGAVTTENAAAAASGAGGASAAASTASAAASGANAASSGSGGAPGSCGGKQGKTCGPDAWCQFPPASLCGNFDATGICQPRPQACDADCPGVCGCDGKFYCNACGANMAGVDVSDDMACKSADVYRAVNMFTNVPRYGILKKSPTRNLCFRLTAVASQSIGIGIYGDGFSILQADVTHDAADCDISPGPFPMPAGASYAITAGSGTLALSMPAGGCGTGIHAKVTLNGAPPWAPPSEPLDADGLIIDSGCP